MKIKVFTYDNNLYNSINEKYKSNKPDLIIPIGGDGTFIDSLRKYMDLNIPFYGIANGTLNFLMNKHNINDINKLLKKISKNEIKIDFVKTPTLKYYYNDVFVGNIINEIVIGDSLRNYPTFELKTGKKVLNFKGSFISMATPLGSTALNRNINGTIIPTIEYPLYSLVTFASTINTNIIVDETKEKQKTILKKIDDRYETIVVIDNKKKLLLHQNDEIEIKTGKYVKIGFVNYKDFQIKRISKIIEK